MGTLSGKRQLTLNLTKSRSTKSSRTWDLHHGITPNSRRHPRIIKRSKVHFVFAVKHDGHHKTRLAADGHLTRQPVETVYSGVVSLRSLRIAMLLSELNQLELWGADIGNAYLEAHTKEKLFIIAGPDLMTWRDIFLSWTRHCMGQEQQENVGMTVFSMS